jgi:hypothetical protein
MEFKPPIYYDDLFDAIDLQIMVSGLSKKELAAHIYPGRRIETAKSLFSRAINPENTDVHLSVEHLVAMMDEMGAEHIINFLCDRYFFQRPEKRDPQAAALDRHQQVEGLVVQFQELAAKMKTLTRKEP